MQFPSFDLERYLDRYEFKAPYLLCCSDCESLSIGNLLAREPGSEKRFLELNLGYTESPGDPELRALAANLHGESDPDRALLFAGAEEGIYNFMHVLLEPGDEVVVQWPCYQSLFQIAENIGCRVKKWPVSFAGEWRADIDQLRDMTGSKTRLVVINNPHNPTGALMHPSQLREVVSICEKHGAHLFSDEVYRGLEHEQAPLPAAAAIYERGVSLGVMSKTYGLAGLRIGWVVSRDKDLLGRMQSFKDYTSICNSAPSEFLARVALKNAGAIAERNLEIIRSNLGLLKDFFARHEDLFEWLPPRAGPIAFPRLVSGEADSFCRKLVQEAGVLLLPGSVYGREYANHLRIGFGRANMPECLEVLEKYLG